MAIAACLPYVALKLAWLAGSSVGSASAAGAAELHDARHVAGNVLTAGLALAAVLLALALATRRGLRVPAVLVLVPVWVGTGLLAPVALSLPFGLVGQAIAGGSAAPAENGLQPWVYLVVYGGFVVQAIALGHAFTHYAGIRWATLLRLPVRALADRPASPATRALAGGGAVVAAAYGLANLAWAAGGDGLAAPAGFETVTQRSLLVSTGLLALAGAWAVRRLVRAEGAGRLAATLAVTWAGSATCFASGVAQVALASDGEVAPGTLVVLALGTASGLALGAAATRRLRSAETAPVDGCRTHGGRPHRR